LSLTIIFGLPRSDYKPAEFTGGNVAEDVLGASRSLSTAHLAANYARHNH
jgi:hypothetical protein